MNARLSCILGLRRAEIGSGVGQFNHRLAQGLGVPYLLLESVWPDSSHPLISIKFEELPERQAHLAGQRFRGRQPYSLFLHTYHGSALERQAACNAARVYCGNHQIFRELRGMVAESQLVCAFAPSLIPTTLRLTARPTENVFFYFGMAGKVDQPRFARLRRLLDATRRPYRLLCSLAVHQTSDGSCLTRALAFLQGEFGSQLIHLGTLSDAGVAYMLNSDPIFIGFYGNGVRSNNTTFNTALEFGVRIITNLDSDSPPVLRGLTNLLNLEDANEQTFAQFLESAPTHNQTALGATFRWEDLLQLLMPPDAARRRVAA